MGMYTEVSIGVRLREDIGPDVVSVLQYMTTGDEPAWKPPVNHRLFSTSRWRWMLRSSGSYYFDAKPVLVWRYDDMVKAWFLTVWTNIKNYDDEWGAFLDFIAPHIDGDGYIGTYRYEEDDDPTLLYVEKGAIVRRGVAR